MTSIIFPSNYAVPDLDGRSMDMPMIGFQAVEIGSGSSVAQLITKNTENWVWLPIPPEGISTDYAQNWGGETANAMKAGISSIVGAVSGGGSISDMFGNSGIFSTGSVGGVMKEALANKFGAAGITGRLMQQSFMSYQGPNYRSHAFSFTLKPQSEQESTNIERIIDFFKFYSAPFQKQTSSLARLYKVPHIFVIDFAPKEFKEGMPQYKVSALDKIDVKYGGEKFNVFKDTSKAVTIEIGLSFKEMDLLDQKDFNTPQGGMRTANNTPEARSGPL